MKLSELIEELEATLIAGDDKLHIDIERIGASDMMSDILAANLGANSLLLTGLTNVQAIKTAVIAGVEAILFVRNKRPPQEVIDSANSHGIPLLTCPHSMFVSSGRLYAQGLTGLNGSR